MEGLVDIANLMEYQLDIDTSEILQENPSAKMKSATMIIPTPSRVEMISKIIFFKSIEFEYEYS